MLITIKNDKLTVNIASRGAELQSIRNQTGTEYLWQGDPTYWSDRALNIFPYVARLTKERYRFQGKEYQMPIHGFLSYAETEVTKRGEDYAVFTLDASEETRRHYPFEFRYQLRYELIGDELRVTTQVTNQDDQTMYFGFGGHPGFRVPLEDDLQFEDYYLDFQRETKPVRIGFTEDCFLNGMDEVYELEQGRYLPLTHDLFDQDAIVLREMNHQVTLLSKKGTRKITVTFPDLDYLGIWHRPQTDAPYVCLEPWSSLPAREDVIEDFEEQENLISLVAGGTYQNTWSMRFE